MFLILFFTLWPPLHAQSFAVAGDDGRFSLKVRLHDRTGAAQFRPSHSRLEDFEFEYRPSGTTHSPRELFYVDVFGRDGFTITRDQVELSKFGRGVSGPGVDGYYLLFELKPASRARIKGYRYLALRLGGFGNPHPPHHLLLLNDDEANSADRFKPSLWHRLYVGHRVFLDSILECERALESP